MKRILLPVALACLLGGGASAALAKAPSSEDRPTLEQLYQQARRERQAEIEAAALANQDPIGDAIENYKTLQVPMEEYQQLVEVILNFEDKKLQLYRKRAMEALMARFATNMEDPNKQRVRREIALELIPMMKHSSSKDPEGLRLIEDMLYSWWRGQMSRVKFRAIDKLQDRRKAYNRMKKFLQNGEK